MSAQSKLTIRVSPGRKADTISWSAVGSYLGVPVNGLKGETSTYLIPTSDTPQQYWAAVVAAVAAALAP
jgi:hypothetical protein